MNASSKRRILWLLIIFLLTVLLGILKGSVNFSVSELLLKENRYILELRFSRTLMAIMAGMGLAVSGIVLQAVLRNPLAEPYLLGTSSGAGMGAVLAIVIGMYKIYLPFAAFLGAILSMILVYNLARQGNKIPAQSLILCGVVVSIVFSALIALLITISGNQALHGLMWWLWGNLQVYDFKLLLIVSIVVILGIAAIIIFSQDLNAISIGEEEAMHLGIKVETIKKILFFITSLITASLVSISGIIGFVGLIIPHIGRLIVGPNHKILIPVTCLIAAIFMVLCDTLARTLLPPSEIPIGIITALIGAPVFVILLKNRQRVR
jgi:iron complex transport system permease protein